METLPQSRLALQLLGGFRLKRGDEPIESIDSPRLQSLFAFLAINKGTPQSRSQLAYALWPDSNEPQALTNLRNLLHTLRKALPEAVESIVSDKKSLYWRESSLDVDALIFLDELKASRGAKDLPTQTSLLTNAASRYQGPLLPSCYDDWIQNERERIRNAFKDIVQHLISLHSDQGDYETAIPYARQLISEEPESEASHRLLMELYEKNGDRASALQAYRNCVTTLHRELQVGPSLETRNLHLRLLADQNEKPDQTNLSNEDKPEFPLQDRQKELALLRTLWNRAMDGSSNIAVVVGEAGIGKTRLSEELCHWVRKQGFTVAKTRSYATEGRLAYAPVCQWLRSKPLYESLKHLDSTWLVEVARVIPEVRRDVPNLPKAEQSEAWSQRQLFDGLSRAVTQHRDPLLLLLDDLQWTDEETLNWMRHLLQFARNERILILGTIREEELLNATALRHFLQEIAREDHLTEIYLERLNAEQSAQLAHSISGRALGDADSWSLFSETEGNPLFIVESVRATQQERSAQMGVALASDRISPESASVPPKIRSVFVSRLNLLSDLARRVVGAASVLGRAFNHELISLMVNCEEDELVDALEELWQRRIIREQENGLYDFSHDKIREVAYEELSPPRRRLLHRRAAQALNMKYLYDLDLVQARVATHFEHAGQTDKAVGAFFRAAEHARALNAYGEAIRLYKRSLDLLDNLPETHATMETELKVQLSLGVCHSLIEGFPKSVMDVYSRAEELCLKLGRPVEAPILRALAIALVCRGHMRQAYPLGLRILKQSESEKDDTLYLEAQYVLGVTCFWLGKFEESFERLESGTQRNATKPRVEHVTVYSQDPMAVCLSRMGWSAWYLGKHDIALDSIERAMDYATERKHPFTQAYVLSIAGSLYTDARHYDAAEEALDQLVELSEKFHFAHWGSQAPFRRAFVQAARGESREGARFMKANIKTYTDLGNVVNSSQFQTMLVQAQLWSGDLEAAERSLDQAFLIAETSDERFFRSEMYRLKGQLAQLRYQDAVTAETAFRSALEIARKQSALPLELRASQALAQLWRDAGHHKSAQDLLSQCVERLPCCEKMPDLNEAKSLLESWRTP